MNVYRGFAFFAGYLIGWLLAPIGRGFRFGLKT